MPACTSQIQAFDVLDGTGELEAPGQATPPAAEVFVDAKETLTPLDFGVGDDKASGSWLDSPVPIPHAPQS